VHIYAIYIRVIFCRVQHTNTTPLSGYSLVVGLTTITDKPCKMWCSDIIYIYIYTHTHIMLLRLTLYSSPNIVRVIKSRMRWAWHAAPMGEKRGCIGSWWGNRREGDRWGDPSVNGRIILGWISRKRDVCIWTGLGWPGIETGGGRL